MLSCYVKRNIVKLKEVIRCVHKVLSLSLMALLLIFSTSHTYAKDLFVSTTSIESYLQSRGDMKIFDVKKNMEMYGGHKIIKLTEGGGIDLFMSKNESTEIHYFPQSSYNNLYYYDAAGNLNIYRENYGNITLKEISYDSAGNILREEKGKVFEATFSLEQLIELVKKVYEVDLDTLASKDNQKYRWGEIHFNYSPHFKQYVYAIHMEPPIFENGATVRIVVISSDKGEILADNYLYAEY